MRNVKAFDRRLRRLEQPFKQAVESEKSIDLQRRLESARVRCNLPPRSTECGPERCSRVTGLEMIAALQAGRDRLAREVKAKLKGTPEND